MKRPNLFLWITLGFLVKVFSVFKGQRIKRFTKIKGPAITLSNHTSFYDFNYTTAVIYPHRTSYLAAKKMFYDPLLGFFLRLARAIPKALLEPDPVATMQALKILKKGGILSIFPEGQISATGVLLPPSFSIAKLIKKANVPVYIIKHHNAYFVNPPWTKKSYSGRIDTEVKVLVTPEEIASLSEQAIFDRMMKALYHNPYQYNLEKKYTYRIGNLQGLEKLLYQCPTCQQDGLEIQNTTIVCPHCGHQATLDTYWRFGDADIFVYHEKQREYLKNCLAQNPAFALTSEVTLQSFRKNRVVDVGAGTITLSRKGYQYVGTIDKVMTTINFDPKLIPSLPSDIGINIQIYQRGQIYQFVFKDKLLPTKYVLLSEILYAESHSH